MKRFLSLACLAAFLPVTILTADDASKLTAITYNIRYDAGGDRGAKDWKQRRGKVTGFLVKQNASVIGLQEVLHRQLLDVEKKLSGYAYFGVGRDDAKKRGEFSPIFYRKSDWKINASGTFWLSDTPENPGSRSWGNTIPRICTWVRLLDKSGKGLYVYNTHWDHRSQPSREKAAALILERIKMRKYANDSFIVMGDFNAAPDNPAIEKLVDSPQLFNHSKNVHRTFSGWKKGLKPGKPIDHIFCSKHFKKATVLAIDNGTASDHHPVVLRSVDGAE